MPFCAKICFHRWFHRFTRFIYLAFGDNYVKTNEDTPLLSGQGMFARECSFCNTGISFDDDDDDDDDERMNFNVA